MSEGELSGVARTMIWTLRPRADEHNRPDALFRDEKAVEWFEQVASCEDTAAWYSPFFQTAIAIRTRIFDDATRDFLNEHEQAAVVELGAGLSTRAYRLGVEQSQWITLDLPEAIELRRQLDPTSEAIACSVLDYDWMDRIPPTLPENILFIAEGLFMFLSEGECRELIGRMRKRFTGATLLLDMPGTVAHAGEVQIAREQGVPVKWMIRDEQDIAALGIKLINVWPVLHQYPERLKLDFGEMTGMLALRNATLLIEAVLKTPIKILEGEKPQPEVIYFRGQSYTAEKDFLYGMHRVCSPERTLERIRPNFEMAGITRLADITGLDRIGIPVTLAVRPNAPTLSNTTGKGFSLEAALVSGAMESIEVFHAENYAPRGMNLPYDELKQLVPVVPVERLALMKNSLFNPHSPEHWVMGWDLNDQQEVAVPFHMVMLNSMEKVIGPTMNFQMGSNGLASGNHFLEALAAGLYEVIERDAVTCHMLAWNMLKTPPPRVQLETIQSPLVRELLEHYEAAQVQVILFDVTSDVSIPTYMAYIYDRTMRGIGLAAGQGTHLDPEVAMVRALTEAAQSRVVDIAGSRDEYFRHHKMIIKKVDNTHQIKQLEAIPPTIDARSRRPEARATFEGDVQIILNRLKKAGLEQSIAFDLTQTGLAVCVVRVIVPGLEGYMHHYYAPGPRARAFLLQKQASNSVQTSHPQDNHDGPH